jgi:hypothetical protein
VWDSHRVARADTQPAPADAEVEFSVKHVERFPLIWVRVTGRDSPTGSEQQLPHQRMAIRAGASPQDPDPFAAQRVLYDIREAAGIAA